MVAVLVMASTAHAQPSLTAPSPPEVEPEPEPAREETGSYGGQILGADIAGVLTAIVLTAATDHGEFLLIPVFTGPTVHLAQGRPGHALGSLALRAGLPFLGGYLGCAADDSDGELDCLGGALLGIGGGMLTAMVIDWTVLGDRDSAETTRPARTTWVAPVSGGALAGVGGAW